MGSDDDHSGEQTLAVSAPFGVGAQVPEEVDPAPPGRRVGRYVLERELGRGGMSVVYEALDPELEREVALKLMRPVKGSRKRTEERLLREAQALAKLAHPNVVHVYDVGTFEGQVYVAMELVRGKTLRRWVVDAKPKWRKILDVLDRAGRGLAAAHHVGLVHLDFKPANVLIGDDGRVRVADFGLARRPRGPESMSMDGSSLERSSDQLGAADTVTRGASTRSRRLDERLTEYGVVLGTPGYMAPETLTGGEVDAPADQFAFCVSAWRCLYGQLPFAGETRALLDRAILAGRLRRPPKSAKVPRYVRRVLTRGLSVDARDRYPSMDELLAALSPRRRDRIRIAVVGGIGAAGVTAALWGTTGEATVDCDGGVDAIAEVWNEQLEDRAEAAFAAASGELGPSTWAREVPRIDAWTQAWSQQYRDACEATHVRHTQSTDQLDRRMLCLSNAKVRLEALGEAFVDADAATVENAADVVGALPEPGRCAEVAELTELALTDDPDGRARAAELERKLAQAMIKRDTGHPLAARPILEEIMARAEADGDRGYVTKARAELGRLFVAVGEPRQAESLLDKAIFECEALGLENMRLQLYVNQVFLQAQQLAQPERSRWYAQAALAMIDRLGGNEAVHAQLLHNMAIAANVRGDPEEALRLAHEAIEVRRRAGLTQDRNEGLIRGNAGNALYNMGRYAEAVTEYKAALQVNIAGLGDRHPSVAGDRENLGNAYRALGRVDEAVAEYEESVGILRDLGYTGGHRIAHALNNLGVAHTELQRWDDAIADYREAIVAFESTATETPPHATAYINLAESLLVLGRIEEAHRAAERGVAMLEKTLPAGHPYVAIGRLGLANVLVAERRYDDALEHLRAIADFTGQEGIDQVSVAEWNLAMARALAQTDPEHPDMARTHGRRAVEILETTAPRGTRVLTEARDWVDAHRK